MEAVKSLFGMRVVRLDGRTYAGWGRMFLRDFLGKLIVRLVSSLLVITSIIACCWLLWTRTSRSSGTRSPGQSWLTILAGN